MYYASSDGSVGEPLTNYSWLQACGFVLLIFGELVYDRQIELPLISYPDPEKDPELCEELEA